MDLQTLKTSNGNLTFPVSSVVLHPELLPQDFTTATVPGPRGKKPALQTTILETIHGLATIRSFGWTGALVKTNHDLVDASQKPVYLLYMVQRWLHMVLELMIAVTAILLVAVALALQTTSGGFLGVALVQLMSPSQELKMIVINYTNLETSLTAISRIKSFEESTPPEDRRETYNEVPESWPPMGRIRFESVSASYSQPGSKKMNFTFPDDLHPDNKWPEGRHLREKREWKEHLASSPDGTDRARFRNHPHRRSGHQLHPPVRAEESPQHRAAGDLLPIQDIDHEPGPFWRVLLRSNALRPREHRDVGHTSVGRRAGRGDQLQPGTKATDRPCPCDVEAQ